MLSEAVRALQRNYSALLIYGAITVGFHVARLLCDYLVVLPVEDSLDPRWLSAYRFSADVVAMITLAVAQAVAFARIGRDMDRPMWKIEHDGEAIRRFFQFWLVVDLAILALIRVPELLPDDKMAIQLFVYFYIGASSIAVPFGGAVMFTGRAGAAEIRQAANMLADRLPQTAGLVAIGCVYNFVFFVMLISEDFPPWATPLIPMIDAYLSCLFFALTWLICIQHRDEDTHDTDFDF